VKLNASRAPGKRAIALDGVPATGATALAAGYGDSAIGCFFGRARFAGIFDGVGNEFRIRVLGSEIRFMTNGGLAGDANATVTTAAGGIVQLAITAIYKV